MNPSSFSGYQGSNPSQQSNGSGDAQLQRMRTDIKNVIPLDIYECMANASLIYADITASTTPLPRHVKDFYSTFWRLYQFTKKIVAPPLQEKIGSWFTNMAEAKALKSLASSINLVKKGVELWVEFCDALAESGMVTLFEGSIQPSFLSDLDIDLEDLDLDEDDNSDLHMQNGSGAKC